MSAAALYSRDPGGSGEPGEPGDSRDPPPDEKDDSAGKLSPQHPRDNISAHPALPPHSSCAMAVRDAGSGAASAAAASVSSARERAGASVPSTKEDAGEAREEVAASHAAEPSTSKMTPQDAAAAINDEPAVLLGIDLSMFRVIVIFRAWTT